ncbi:hypothetical protein [Legionella israelensis]|uniref:hypothetical protein n=1 Tax=Legionella israelensis TaxID=454 RepID=UPI0014311F32|nr:hypothetical protein [Legionella israelensis]
MRKVFRLLGVILEAIVSAADDKPRKRYMSVNEAQDLYDADLISMREYNESFKSRNT